MKGILSNHGRAHLRHDISIDNKVCGAKLMNSVTFAHNLPDYHEHLAIQFTYY